MTHNVACLCGAGSIVADVLLDVRLRIREELEQL